METFSRLCAVFTAQVDSSRLLASCMHSVWFAYDDVCCVLFASTLLQAVLNGYDQLACDKS